MNTYSVNLVGYTFFTVHADKFDLSYDPTGKGGYVYFYLNNEIILTVCAIYLESIEKWNDLIQSFSDIVYTK